jgi:hypothetical protein
LSILYGLFPRALERSLKFENLSKTKDAIEVVIVNGKYGRSFLEPNELFSEDADDKGAH